MAFILLERLAEKNIFYFAVQRPVDAAGREELEVVVVVIVF